MIPWKILVGPGLLLGLKFAKIQLDDPSNLAVIRWLYGVSQVLLFALCAYMYHVITQCGDEEKLVTIITPPRFNSSPDEGPIESTFTYKEYDLSELIKLCKNFALGAAITVGIHYYMGVVPALVLQIVTQPITLIEHPLFSIYVLYKDPDRHEKLRRPFVDNSPTAKLEAMKKASIKLQEPQPPPLEQIESEIMTGERAGNITGSNVQTSLSTAGKRPTRSSSSPLRAE